jgi:WhiB family transcriptional regulator, redox-sensing transcriptional regulator
MPKLAPGTPRVRHWHLTEEEKARKEWAKLWKERQRREAAILTGAVFQPYPEAPDWTGALCVEAPRLFFAEDGERPAARQVRVKAAKQLCMACPLRAACHAYAVKTGQHYGIWGGVNFESEEERPAA